MGYRREATHLLNKEVAHPLHVRGGTALKQLTLARVADVEAESSSTIMPSNASPKSCSRKGVEFQCEWAAICNATVNDGVGPVGSTSAQSNGN